MIKNMKKYGYIAFVLCVLAGCASQKQISYLQDVPDDYRQKITQDYDLRIHPDDLLSIMVNSKDPELAQMFNLPMVSYQIANSNTGYAGEQNRILGEVNRLGTFEITSDRITLLDTLSLAGDLTICSC